MSPNAAFSLTCSLLAAATAAALLCPPSCSLEVVQRGFNSSCGCTASRWLRQRREAQRLKGGAVDGWRDGKIGGGTEAGKVSRADRKKRGQDKQINQKEEGSVEGRSDVMRGVAMGGEVDRAGQRHGEVTARKEKKQCWSLWGFFSHSFY